jgi:hypothetical protein
MMPYSATISGARSQVESVMTVIMDNTNSP